MNSCDCVAKIGHRVRTGLYTTLALSRNSVLSELHGPRHCVDAVDTFELEPLHRATADQKLLGPRFLHRDVSHRALGCPEDWQSLVRTHRSVEETEGRRYRRDRQ